MKSFLSFSFMSLIEQNKRKAFHYWFTAIIRFWSKIFLTLTQEKTLKQWTAREIFSIFYVIDNKTNRLHIVQMHPLKLKRGVSVLN